MRILRPLGLDGGLLGTLSGKADPGLVQNLTLLRQGLGVRGCDPAFPFPVGREPDTVGCEIGLKRTWSSPYWEPGQESGASWCQRPHVKHSGILAYMRT